MGAPPPGLLAKTFVTVVTPGVVPRPRRRGLATSVCPFHGGGPGAEDDPDRRCPARVRPVSEPCPSRLPTARWLTKTAQTSNYQELRPAPVAGGSAYERKPGQAGGRRRGRSRVA